MLRQSTCIKVPKIHGETVIILAKKLKILDSELEIQKDEKSILIPIVGTPAEDIVHTLRNQVAEAEIQVHSFPAKTKPMVGLDEMLKSSLPPHLLKKLPHSADIVGDIIIVEIPVELENHKNAIGEALLKTNKNAKTVLEKASAISGIYRLREFKTIAGEPKTATVHKEHGYQLYVDIAKTYFSPRLSFEHHRVATLVNEDEIVVDLFAGVGPFAISIAKAHENVKVYAVDVNPYAISLLERNVRLNKVYGKVHPILGDARQIVREKICGLADRVIMNLPEKSFEYVDVACDAMKHSGGIVHFYCFAKESSLENVQRQFGEAVIKSGKIVRTISSKIVRPIAPHEWQIVLDAKIS